MSQAEVSDKVPTTLDRLSHVNGGDASQACHADVYHPAIGVANESGSDKTAPHSDSGSGGNKSAPHGDSGSVGDTNAPHGDGHVAGPEAAAHLSGGHPAQSAASARSESASSATAHSLPPLEIVGSSR